MVGGDNCILFLTEDTEQETREQTNLHDIIKQMFNIRLHVFFFLSCHFLTGFQV